MSIRVSERRKMMDAYSIAGVLAGITGLIVFLVLHQLWIKPIWFILPFGLVIAALGGLAVGRAYHEMLPGLPSQPWTTPAVVALIIAILTPAIILAELRRPMFDFSVPGGRLAISTGQAVLIFVLELLVTSTLAAGLLGYLIGRTQRAMLTTALAGFIFALGPGHNIPFIGGTPGVWKEMIIMGSVIIISAVVLVAGSYLLMNVGQ